MRSYKRHINKIESNGIRKTIMQSSWGIWFQEYSYDEDEDYDNYEDWGSYIYYEYLPSKNYKELSQRGYLVVDMYSIYPIEIKRIKIIDDILS